MSSLIDYGPHTVRIYMEVERLDSRGNPVKGPSDEPVEVHGCLMQPVASARGAFPATSVTIGQQVDASWRLMARNVPLGWWSRVEWTDPATGIVRRFFVLGGPLQYHIAGAYHTSATLQEER